jgi:glycosyl transferase family 2
VEELTAVVILGPVRERAQKVVDRLCRQTLGARLEIVLVDVAGSGFADLVTSGPSRIQYLRRPGTLTWGEARAEGWRVATSPAVAFIEDHCFPARTWAEHVAMAFRGEWVAVGYAFTNANPQSRTSRASFLTDYGIFAHPAVCGEVVRTQSNNIAYRRAAVERLNIPIEQLLQNDWNTQEALRAAGGRIYQEARAIASHTNFETIQELTQEGFSHCRTMAAARVQREGWGPARRIAQGLATFGVAPVVRGYRLVRTLRDKPRQRRGWVRCLPELAAAFASSAVGEATGYLAGIGDADKTLRHSLLATARRRDNDGTSPSA